MVPQESLEIFPLKILRDLSQISFLGIPSRPGATRPLFDLLERHGVGVNFLLEEISNSRSRDLVICIPSEAFSRLQAELEGIKARMQPRKMVIRQPVAVVRILGPHFDIQSGPAGLLFSALARAGIKVYSNATTITSSLCVIADREVAAAVRAIGQIFALPAARK